MNKPLKMLLAVGVLAFTAAGLYYALLAPSKPRSSAPARSVRTESETPRVIVPGAKVGSELPGSMPAGTTPTPALSAPAAPTTSTPAAPAPTTSASSVPNFAPVSEPMKPLPQSLPGFEPAPASPAATTAPASAPAPANGAAPSPSGAAVSAGNAAPAAAPSPSRPASDASSKPVSGAPAVPAPSSVPAVVPAAPKPQPATAAPATRVDTYTVKEGDSLASIWRDLTGNERGWEALQAANPGVDASRLKIGQVLKVPDWKSKGATAVKPAVAAAAGTYTVQSGDTLSSIAAKVYGDSKLWKRIFEANKDAIGADPGNLKVGQMLRVPPKSDEAVAPAQNKPAPKPVPVPAPAPSASPSAPTPASDPAPASTPAPR